ncbi:MAG: tetratricopeptide repeat protein [Parachlamydiales bacterium]
MDTITKKLQSECPPIVRNLDEGRQLSIHVRIAEGGFTLKPYLVSPKLASYRVPTRLIGCPSSGKLEELTSARCFLKQARMNATANGVMISPKLLGGSPVEEATKQLVKACQEGKDELALNLLKENLLPKDLKDSEGNPLICWMAQHEMVATLTCALDKGWNPNLPNTSGIYPLHYAAMKSVPLTKALLKASANPFVQTPKGSTPAGVAKDKDKIESLSLLVLVLKNTSSPSWESFEKSYRNFKCHLSDLDIKSQFTLAEGALLLGDNETLNLLHKTGLWGELTQRLVQEYPFAEQEVRSIDYITYPVINYHNKISKHNKSHFNKSEGKLNDLDVLHYGWELFKKGKYKEALPILLQGLQMPTLKNDIEMFAECCSFIGEAYFSLTKYREAIEYYEQALQVFQKLRNSAGKGDAFGGLGNAYYKLREYRKAIEYYKEALKIALELDHPDGKKAAYGNLGNAYHNLEEYQKAIEYHQRALEIALELSKPEGKGKAYSSLGNAYCGLGQYQKAIEYHKEALKFDDADGEGAAYGGLGNAYYDLGEYRKAIEYHEKALEIAIKLSKPEGKSKAYGSLGNAYCGLGQYQKAIKYHEKALEIDLKLGDPDGEGATYANIGIVYKSVGEYQKAIEYHEKALEIAVKRELPGRQGSAYGNLGIAWDRMGKYREAVKFHKKALEIALKLENKAGEARAYCNLGLTFHHLGESRKAIKYHEKALEIADKHGLTTGKRAAYANLGLTYMSLGQYQKAIEYHEKDLRMSIALEDLLGEGRAYTNLAIACLKQNDLPNAEINGGKAVRGFLKIQRMLDEDSWKITIFEEQSQAYFLLFRALIGQGKEIEALSTVDFGRSRALSDLLDDRTKRALDIQPKTQGA